MYSKKFINLVFVVVLNINFVQINCRNDENDLRITLEEKNALEKLKSLVSEQIKEDFMKTDFYLIRWLRKAKLNVETAKTLILQNESWREENHMSSILDEDFSDAEQDYHITIQGKDKKGRPFLEIDLGDSDLRAAVIQGKLQRIWRYTLYQTEQTIQAILKDQEQGKPVTRFVILYDSSGVNPLQHACPRCLSFLMQLVSQYDQHYPDFIDEHIFINVPTVGRLFLSTVREVLVPDLASRIKVFDTNRATWMPYLDAKIDKDQRSPRYGGTAVRA